MQANMISEIADLTVDPPPVAPPSSNPIQNNHTGEDKA